MSRPASGDEIAETAAASPTGSTAVGGRGLVGPAGSGARELRAGDVLERYEIVGVLGAGGMGRVYRARDPDLNRDVAIKVLRRPDGSRGSGDLERRLLREAQAMAKLSHPNLATVYDVGSVDGEVFIAFEFIDGQTLGEWARAGRTFAERVAALVAAGRGLEAAHSAGVIHRDFKPDNVLVGHDGQVKVVDFGLARGVGETRVEPSAARGDELAVDLTLTGSILGTPAYMAPEQHHGTVADARADQFGFAVAAWEVLYGERPFRGTSIAALAAAICSGDITPPPARSVVTPAVEAVLRRALAVEPDARFPDMGGLLAALAPPPKARPRSVWHDWRTAAISLGMVLAALGAVYVGFETNRVDPPKRRGEASANPDAGPPITASEVDSLRDAAQEVAKANRPKIDACYDTEQAKHPALPAGTVSTSLEISTTGKVISARILSDDFDGEHGIATCLAARTLEWTFSPPPAGAAQMTFSFEFEPRRFDVTREGDVITVSRATWDDWTEPPGLLGAGGTVVPAEKDGRQIGYVVYAIAPGSVQAALGLESGDTVTHINGHALDSATAFSRVAPELDGSADIVVTLRRGANPVTLTYRVEPTPRRHLGLPM